MPGPLFPFRSDATTCSVHACALCDTHLGDDNICHHGRFLCRSCCWTKCIEETD